MTDDEAKKIADMFHEGFRMGVDSRRILREAFELAAAVSEVDIELLKQARRDESRNQILFHQFEAAARAVTPRDVAYTFTHKPPQED